MGDVDEMVAWLRRQLDDDQQAAEAACMAHDGSRGSGEWEAVPFTYGPPEDGWGDPKNWEIKDERGNDVVDHQMYEGGGTTEWYAAHITRHDPARVLREVAKKRDLLDLHEPDGDHCGTCLESESDIYGRNYEPHPCQNLRLLASMYADRPGYRAEWRPT